MKRGKRILSFLLALVMCLGMLPAMTVEAEAASCLSDYEIKSRIIDLAGKFGIAIERKQDGNLSLNAQTGGFFTTTQSTCGNNACSQCDVRKIINTSWFRNAFGSVSSADLFAKYYCFTDDYNSNRGHVFNSNDYYMKDANNPYGIPLLGVYSCAGFASFAEWYIFKESNNDAVDTYCVGICDIDQVSQYAKVGDMLRIAWWPSGSSTWHFHSGIYLGQTSGGYVWLLNCNGEYGNRNIVSVKNYYGSSVIITRATCQKCDHSAGYETQTDANGNYSATVCKSCGTEFQLGALDTSKQGVYTVTKSNVSLSAKPYKDAATMCPVKGADYTIVGAVTNAYGNVWYQTDKGYYIFSENLKWKEALPSHIDISPASDPITINQGSSIPIWGMITSTYAISEVTAYYDGAQYATVWGNNSTSMNYRYTAINNDLKGASLSAGAHTLTITAKDTAGGTATKNIGIVVNGSLPLCAEPTISYADIECGKRVTIHQNQSGATLHYQIGGAAEQTSGQTDVSFDLTDSAVITAYSTYSGMYDSRKASRTVEVYQLQTPEITVTQNTEGAIVTISGDTGATLYYSTDGDNFERYNGATQLEANCTVFAYARKLGSINSDTATAEVTVSAPSSPVISLSNTAQDIAVGDSVTISWTSADLAESYQLITQREGDISVVTTNIYATQHTEVLDKAGIYTFQVVAINNIGVTESVNKVKVTVHEPSTVTFADYDGTELSSQEVRYGYDAVQPENIPSRRGYTYTGWDKSFYGVKEDLTVLAKYQINTYTVKFYDPEGKLLTSQQVTYGSGIDSVSAESKLTLKTGYSFKNWYITRADDDSERNINAVNSDMELIAVTGWENESFPVVITNLAANRNYDENTDVSTGYDVSFHVSSVPGHYTKAKIVVTAMSSDNKLLATAITTINSQSDAQEVEKELFLSCDGTALADRIEVNVLAVDGNDRTGGAIAESVSCVPSADPSKNAVWSEWMDTLPEGVTTTVESKTVYRGRENTKNLTTTNSSQAPEGYTLQSKSSYWGDWSGWLDYSVSEITSGGTKTREVKTQQVMTDAGHTEYRYGRWHGVYGTSYCNVQCARFRGGGTPYKEYTSWMKTSYPWVDQSNWWQCGWESYNGMSHDHNGEFYNSKNGLPSWHSYSSDGTTNTWSLWYWEETRWVDATYKTQYAYRDLRYSYTYYKWDNGAWSDWGDDVLTSSADGSFDAESKTMYRYVINDPNVTQTDTSGVERTISYDASGLAGGTDAKATILVYKSRNTDPTEAQMEFAAQTTLSQVNGYTFKAKEEPTADTGDYVIALAIEGRDGLVNIGMVEAPKSSYEVIFQTEDGTILSEQLVEEGGTAVVPEAPEKTGTTFVGWNRNTTNVTSNMTVLPVYAPLTFTVAYVDYLNHTCDLVRYNGNDTLGVPETVPSFDGYTFKGWSLGGGVPIAEGTVVEDDTVVTAIWEAQEYTVKFCDATGAVIDTQAVKYGEAATPPDDISVGDNQLFLGWYDSTTWWNVKEDITVYPIVVYSETAMVPVSSIGTYYVGESASIVLTAEDGATIYYTTDGTMPTMESTPYTGVIDVDETTEIIAIAVEAGKNDSEVIDILFEYADHEDYDPSVETVEIGTYLVDAEAGKDVTININLEDNPGLAGYLFTVECNRNVFYADFNENSDFDCTAGEASENGTLFCAPYLDSGYQILWFSSESSSKGGNLFSIKLKVADGVQEGTYPITVSYSPANTVTAEDVAVDEEISFIPSLTGSGTVLGDINDDGYITTADVIRIARYVAGSGTFAEAQRTAADVTCDGKVTNADVIRLARYIMGMVKLG